MDSLSIDYHEHLINETNDDFGIIDQIGRISSNAKDKVSTKKECVILVFMTIISVLLLILLLTAMGFTSLAFVIFSGNISKYIEIDSQVTEAGIVPGHYVLVQYDIKENTATKIIGSVLQFSLNFTSSETLTNYTATIYKTYCSSSKQVQPFHQLQPVNQLINFTDCPNQICLFDQYVYEVASNESKIEYSITNDDYNENEYSEFLILAYQHQPAVTTLSPSSNIKSKYMTSRNLTFTLNSEDIQKSTYYFFGIQLITGPPITNLTITRSGNHVFYNASHESPVCTFSVLTSCSFTIGNKDDSDCIFTHFTLPFDTDITDGSGLELSSENDLYNQKVIPFHVDINIDNPTATACNYAKITGSVVVGLAVLLIASLVIVVCLTKRIKKKRKTKGKMKLIHARSNRLSVDDRSFELTTSGEKHQTTRKSSTQTYCPPPVSSQPRDKSIKWVPNLKTIEFNEKGVSFRFNQYGPIVVIPEGAVKGPAYLQYGVSHVYTPGFRCEEGSYEPVSSFVYMHINEKLLKPVQVYVPIDVHCEDTKNLVLLCKGNGENAAFKVLKDVSLSLTMGMVSFEMYHFCEFCIADDKTANCQLERKYRVAAFTRSKRPQEVEIHLVILCSYSYIEKLKDYYAKQHFKFLGSKILGIKITVEGVVISMPEIRQWKGYLLGTEKITVLDADVYEYLNCSMEDFGERQQNELEISEKNGDYPPRFKVVCKANVPNAEPESVALSITEAVRHRDGSAAQLNNDFKYNILLESEESSGQGAGEIFHETEPSIEHLCTYLTPVLSDCYYNFGLKLGITVKRLDAIETKNSSHIQDKCIPEILKEWKNNLVSLPSIPKALNECGYPIFSSFIAEILPFIFVPHEFEVIEPPRIAEPVSDRDSSFGLQTFQKHLQMRNISKDVLDTEPDLSDLMEHVLPHIHNWKVFGVQVGVGVETLTALDIQERGYTAQCFMKVIKKWKNANQPPFKWVTVIKVLYKPTVKGYVACEEIYKFFQKKGQQHPDSRQ